MRLYRLICLAITFALAASSAFASSLGRVGLGSQVSDVVAVFGAPGLVETTDQGQEWRWFDVGGLDVDLLTDDSLIVQQVLVSQPSPVTGKPAALVEPREYPYLGQSEATATKSLQAQGAVRQPEPDRAVSAWRIGDTYLILELDGSVVRKILALDRSSAARLGYIGSPVPLGSFHAPRLIKQFPVDYPKRAIDQGAQGVVVVRADIEKTGAVSAVRVIVSSGNVDIDSAETLSIRKSTFRPARCDDNPCDAVFLDREEYTLSR